jgi:nucleoside-diphosphate-sugar epimerase
MDAVLEAAGDMRGIFHLAALGSVPRSVENPRESNAVNTDGTLNVLWAARERGVGRVVFAGWDPGGRRCRGGRARGWPRSGRHRAGRR